MLHSGRRLIDGCACALGSGSCFHLQAIYGTSQDPTHAYATRLRQLTGSARTLATALLDWLHRPQAQPDAAVELAQAASALPYAYLGCAKLAAGSERGRRCSRCRVARYCGRACSHADWRAVHRRMCAALAATRTAQQGGTAAAG